MKYQVISLHPTHSGSDGALNSVPSVGKDPTDAAIKRHRNIASLDPAVDSYTYVVVNLDSGDAWEVVVERRSWAARVVLR